MTKLERDLANVENKLQGWIKALAIRYSEGATLEADDLYQEALIVMFEAIQKAELDPDSQDFESYIKTVIAHKFIDRVRSVREAVRDCKRTISGHGDDSGQLDHGRGDLWDNHGSKQFFQNPIDGMIEEEFMDMVKSDMTDEELRLFNEMVNPSEAFVEHLHKQLEGKARVWASRPAIEHYATFFGISYGRIKYVWNSLRVKIENNIKVYREQYAEVV